MFEEYYRLFLENKKNWKAILYGFYKDLTFYWLKIETQKEILRRRDICILCLSRSFNAKKEGYITKRIDDHCTFCKCNINAKTANLKQNCLIKLW